MIQIQLFDYFNTELALDDIILVHFPNPDIKLLAVLKFLEDSKDFVLQYETEEDYTWTGIFPVRNNKLERIGPAKEFPNLLKHCARYDEREDVKKLAKILNRINLDV
jgi:hypothetical protein